VTVLFPLFVTVIVCGVERLPIGVGAKVRRVGENTILSSTRPVPDSPTDCGEPTPLSVVVSAADWEPAADGLKAIETVQLAPADKEIVQVLAVSSKELALVPVTR
jgi:hypothetical protein